LSVFVATHHGHLYQAKALAEKNQRDLQTQREQAEKHVSSFFSCFPLRNTYIALTAHAQYISLHSCWLLYISDAKYKSQLIIQHSDFLLNCVILFVGF